MTESREVSENLPLGPYELFDVPHKELILEITDKVNGNASDLYLLYLVATFQDKRYVIKSIFPEYRRKNHRIEPELVKLTPYGSRVTGDWRENSSLFLIFDQLPPQLIKSKSDFNAFVHESLWFSLRDLERQ